MTGTVVASLAAVAFFLLLIEGVRRGFGISGLPPRARAVAAGAAGTLFPLAGYGAVRLIDEVEALRPLAAFFAAHETTGFRVTLSAAVLGFVLFMGGILHLLLTSGRSESFTLPQLAAALRTGIWLRSRRWRRRVVIVAGVALLTFGLFGLGVVGGSVGLKLLLAAVFLYGAAAAAIAAVRA